MCTFSCAASSPSHIKRPMRDLRSAEYWAYGGLTGDEACLGVFGFSLSPLTGDAYEKGGGAAGCRG
jgi:hypothetical protein